MIDGDHDLPITRQAKALNLARSTVYQKSRPVSAADLVLMHRLDDLHLDVPFAGARMPRALLQREGISVGRRHVTTLMKRMGREAIDRRPNTSKPTPGHKIHPKSAGNCPNKRSHLCRGSRRSTSRHRCARRRRKPRRASAHRASAHGGIRWLSRNPPRRASARRSSSSRSLRSSNSVPHGEVLDKRRTFFETDLRATRC